MESECSIDIMSTPDEQGNRKLIGRIEAYADDVEKWVWLGFSNLDDDECKTTPPLDIQEAEAFLALLKAAIRKAKLNP